MNRLLVPALAAMLMAGGCARKNDSGERARLDYMKALADSVENVQREIDSCNRGMTLLAEDVSAMLGDFTAVDNSREVEGYTILSGWEKRYPLQSTGIVARITQSEGLELIAALGGGVFDRISVSTAAGSAQTATVPHDQALNYRRENLTTVMFSGAAADSVAQLIASGMTGDVTVTFLNGSRTTGKWKMPTECATMIADTWQLYSARNRQKALERRSAVLQGKLRLLREHKDREHKEGE